MVCPLNNLWDSVALRDVPDRFDVGSDEDECFCDCDRCCDGYILKVMPLLQLQSVVTVTF